MAQIPSRRRVLALAGTLPLAAIPAALALDRVAPAGADDAELIARCQQLAACRTTIDAYNQDTPVASEAQWDEALGTWGETVSLITDTAALTPAGLRAKAAAARIVLKANLFGGAGPVMIQGEAQEEDELCWNLIHDLLGEEPDWGEREEIAAAWRRDQGGEVRS